VGKLRLMERCKDAQNSDEKQCAYELAGEEAANDDYDRCHRHNDAYTHPEVGGRAKPYGCRQGQRGEQRDEARQNARFPVQSLPVKDKYGGKGCANMRLSISQSRRRGLQVAYLRG
jgi:hypothetical protein